MKRPKCRLFPALILISVASLPAFAADDKAKKPTMSQDQIQTGISASNGHVLELSEQKKQAIAQIKSHLPFTREGITLFKKYDALLRARYVDDEGEFQPGVEISNADRENVIRLFKTYLHREPFTTKVSSALARKQISAGIDQLKDRASKQDSPDESNSSEVQILSKNIDDEAQKVEELVQLADNFGFKVDSKAVANGHAPASVGAKH